MQNPNGLAYIHSEATCPLFYAIAYYVYRIKADGTEPNQIINTTTSSQFNRGLAIDYPNKKIYWANQVDGTIKRANFDGTSQEPVLSGLAEPWDIELDLVNRKIYWTEIGGSGKINRANMNDGSGITPLITGVQSNGVAVDPTHNKLYYTDTNTKKVFAASLTDGSGATPIYSTLTSPGDIDMHYATGKLYVADYGGSGRLIPMDASGTVTTDLAARGLYVEIGDLTAPYIYTIRRQTPATQQVEAGVNATFRITFSEPVLSIDATDFTLAAPITGTLTVNHVSEYKVYDIVVSNISGTGVLNLNVAGNTNLMDFRGNALGSTVDSEETYTVVPSTDPPVTAVEGGAQDAAPLMYNGTTPRTMVLETRSLAGYPGKLQVTDLTGRTQFTQDTTLPQKQEFSTQNLVSGLYIVTLTTNKKRFSWKMMLRN